MKLRNTLAVLMLLTLISGGWALAQILGIGPYAGGTLTVVYRMTDKENDPSPGTMTLKIVPEGGKFKVTETFEVLAERDQLTVLVFSHGFAHVPKGALDVTPISALDTREVLPNREILLPEGAKLVTRGEVTIGGVKAVEGTYTHPKFEDQRAIIAISDLESRKILPYPPLLRIEKREGDRWIVTALTELLSVSQTRP
ncbi:hypothetical protein LM602_01350 [Candidatus Acetothermia bacterium]|jgi:hypothetical protein|nr:hypothetical protein [Candidatus Acetothermia bacterium]MCI2431189.1 hypothetical protein [Candidatus Acetothermia bacterium]MCI2437252.1 hypothetical protein [Candidatus Acetothermia bacterium]